MKWLDILIAFVLGVAVGNIPMVIIFIACYQKIRADNDVWRNRRS
jgi:hypothetical protein